MGCCLVAPLGNLWEFLSWFARQLVFSPQILLFQDLRLRVRRNLKKNVPCPATDRAGFVNSSVCRMLSLIRENSFQPDTMGYCKLVK